MRNVSSLDRLNTYSTEFYITNKKNKYINLYNIIKWKDIQGIQSREEAKLQSSMTLL